MARRCCNLCLPRSLSATSPLSKDLSFLQIQVKPHVAASTRTTTQPPDGCPPFITRGPACADYFSNVCNFAFICAISSCCPAMIVWQSFLISAS